MREGDLPVVDPADVKPGGEQRRVAGVLLAAGESSRFADGNKLLATYDGEPLVRHAALTLVQAGLDPLVAVVGHEADGVESAIAGLGFETVHNPDFADGQATSVSQGVAAIAGADAVVIALGDMPAVDPRSIEALVDAYRAGEADALAAAYQGTRGNPVVFDSRYFAELRDVEGDRGGRGILLAGGDSALVETGDRGVLADVDTRDDLDDVREVHG
jgi:molybdenum cofactor cytidylyltransferase